MNGRSAVLALDQDTNSLLTSENDRQPTLPDSREPNKLRVRIAKSFVGSMVLFLPSAFANAGLFAALIGLVVIAAISVLCINMLIDCAFAIEATEAQQQPPVVSCPEEAASPELITPVACSIDSVKASSHKKITYGDVGHHAFGDYGRCFVDISLTASQIGLCCIYYSYVSLNLHAITSTVSDCAIDIPIELFYLLQFPVYLMLTFVRDIRTFDITNVIATFLITAGLSYVVLFCFYRLWRYNAAGLYENDDLLTRHNWRIHGVFMVKPATFPLFLGSAIFAFEGIGLILPLFGSVSPEIKPRFKAITTGTIAVILVVFLSFGSIGYIAFGDDVSAAVTSALPQKDITTITVQVGYCLALVFTYPLMMYPVVSIVETLLLGAAKASEPKEDRCVAVLKNLIRAGLVTFTGLISYASGGALNNLVALVGALFSIPLAFIYPSLLHNRIIGTHPKRNVAIAAIGGLSLLFATSISITTWKNVVPGKCRSS